jgi:hypothetical protein
MSRRGFEFTAIAALVVAAGVVVQPIGCNQTAHLALTKSLAHGSPQIDVYEAETCDDAWIDGHFYAAKAPGLALFTTPWYLALETTGLVSRNPAAHKPWPAAMTGMPRSAVWQVGLVGAVLPFAVLLLLLRWSTNRLVPELGTPTAVAVGAGTLLLPFATVLFAHVLAAALLFGAFCILLRERAGPSDPRLLAIAGVVAGLAVVVEFPTALGVALLCGYGLTTRPRISRGLSYAAGAILGVLPLAAFNTWAFGSPFETSYSDAVIEPGVSGHDVLGANDRGFFGVGQPGVRDATELLFSAKGLFVLSPLLAAGCVGLVVLARRGARAEALLVGALGVFFLMYNAGYYLPFGGWTPGPRFLVVVIPFLALGVAAALRAAPLATAVLAGISIFWMGAATLGEPLLADDHVGSWITRIRGGDLAYTVVGLVAGGHGLAEALPLLAALGISVAMAASLVPFRPVTRQQALLALAVSGSWAIVASATPDLLRTDRSVGQWTGLATTIALAAVTGVVVVAVARHRPRALLLCAPLVLLLVPGFAEHTKWSLAVVVSAAGVVMLVLGWELKGTVYSRRGTRTAADP